MQKRRITGLGSGMAGFVLLGASVLSAQTALAPGVSSAQPPSVTLEELATQIRQLQATLAEVRAGTEQARTESAALRQELAATQKELALVLRKLSEPQPTQETNTAYNGAIAGATTEQTPPHNSQRVAHLAEDMQLLSDKVNDQYQTKVESASKYRVRLSGFLVLNVFGNRGNVDNQDMPSLARPKTSFGSEGNFGATIRQSRLGLQVSGPTLAGARTSGDLSFDFFGGFPSTSDGVTMGLMRLRTGRMRMDWKNASVVVGQDEPFFSPLSPSSLASLALPALSYSGNLWVWTPQARVESRIAISEESKLELQVGILDPLTGEPPYSQFYRYPQAGERGRQPAYASRVAWSRKAWGESLTLGVGGYYARQNWGYDRNVDSWAVTADWSVPLGPRFAWTGEFYRGRALGGLGGGTGRSTLYSGALTDPAVMVAGLNSFGGWSQLKFMATQKLELNTAFGEELPFERDLERFPNSMSYYDPTIERNQSGFFNMIYHARSNLLFSAEYRKLWTARTYEDKSTADQVNLSVGVLF